MVCAVLLHGYGSLKWPVSYGQRDAVCLGLLDDLGGLVAGVASNNFPINLSGQKEREEM